MSGNDDTVGIGRHLAEARALDQQARQGVRSNDPAAAAEAWLACAARLREASTLLDLQLVDVLEGAAGATARTGRPDDAAAIGRDAVALLRQSSVAGKLSDTEAASRLSRFGLMFCALQRWPDAIELLRQAEARFAAAVVLPQALWRDRMQGLGALASAYRFAGLSEQAPAALADGAAWAESQVADSTSLEDRTELAQLRNAYGDALMATGGHADALVVLRRCAADTGALAGETGAPALRNLHAAVLNKLGRAAAAAGDRAQAIGLLEESVAVMRRLVEVDGYAALADDFQAASDDLDRLRRD